MYKRERERENVCVWERRIFWRVLLNGEREREYESVCLSERYNGRVGLK